MRKNRRGAGGEEEEQHNEKYKKVTTFLHPGAMLGGASS